VLLPEIALTTQFLDRFVARFGVCPAEWHSALPPRRRARTWRAVAEGEVSVIAGARSALFLPYADLGLIVVDEEHDPAYKQEDGLPHARDMAVVRYTRRRHPDRARLGNPSVGRRSMRGADATSAHLPSALAGSIFPHRAHRFAEKAAARTPIAPRPPKRKDQAEKNEQALLFLNRRGYAPLTVCRNCGFRLGCLVRWLVDHRFRRRLVCHHCGFSMPPPAQCPGCQESETFVAVGPGVERLQQEAAELFPGSRILVLSSDLVESVERLREELKEVAQGRFDIIIGTQLVAKGHHFPNLNLVGVIDADIGLANGDPRAAERTFQLLYQVVGRAGREEGQGIGYLQTYQPSIPSSALLAADRDAFTTEIELREKPSIRRWTPRSLLISAKERASAESYGCRLLCSRPERTDVRIRAGGSARSCADAIVFGCW
jgi:primosomal protein N' (replication factor Y)